MIDLLALSYAGLAWKTEQEKTAKSSAYEATKGQTHRQFLPAYIRDRIQHRTGAPKQPFQINAIKQQGIKTMSLWYNFYIGLMAVTGVQDHVFLRESLLNLSTIRHPEVGSIKEWLREMIHLGSPGRFAILI
jgi:hypothetical protein